MANFNNLLISISDELTTKDKEAILVKCGIPKGRASCIAERGIASFFAELKVRDIFSKDIIDATIFKDYPEAYKKIVEYNKK